MVKKHGVNFPGGTRYKAEFLRFAEHFWIGALLKTAATAYEDLSGIYGQAPHQLSYLINQFYPNRAAPDSELESELDKILETRRGRDFFGVAERVANKKYPELRPRLRFIKNSGPYMRRVFSHRDEDLTARDIAHRL